MKWYKFGFTRLFDNLSLEIRNGRMTRDEALVFKAYDTDASAGVRFTAHTAFDDPNTPPDAAIRESIEMWALVFYD